MLGWSSSGRSLDRARWRVISVCSDLGRDINDSRSSGRYDGADSRDGVGMEEENVDF